LILLKELSSLSSLDELFLLLSYDDESLSELELELFDEDSELL
jgi:hypothetical protein